MREIKFRAWDIENKKMYKVYDLHFGLDADDWWEVEVTDSEKLPNDNWDEEMTILSRNLGEVELMQYTGLKDKNGKDIYEGDIVEVPDYYAKRGIVEYSAPRFHIFDGDDGCTDFDWEEWEYFEVIGNIYENPELLNK